MTNTFSNHRSAECPNLRPSGTPHKLRIATNPQLRWPPSGPSQPTLGPHRREAKVAAFKGSVTAVPDNALAVPPIPPGQSCRHPRKTQCRMLRIMTAHAPLPSAASGLGRRKLLECPAGRHEPRATAFYPTEITLRHRSSQLDAPLHAAMAHLYQVPRSRSVGLHNDKLGAPPDHQSKKPR